MSREIGKDFEALKIFIEEYKLEGVLSDKDIVKSLSHIHKKYYAYLTLVSEISESEFGCVFC